MGTRIMTPDRADLPHIMPYCTTTRRTDINDAKPFSIVYVIHIDACKCSSLPHLHDKPEIA